MIRQRRKGNSLEIYEALSLKTAVRITPQILTKVKGFMEASGLLPQLFKIHSAELNCTL